MEESQERIISKTILKDYLKVLNGIYIFLLNDEEKFSPLIINALDKLKKSDEGRNYVKKYFNYEISDEEVSNLLENKISKKDLSYMITNVATLLYGKSN